MTEQMLHPLVAELAQDFEIVGEEKLLMPEEKVAAWQQRLTPESLGEERVDVTAHLLVLAVRFAREAPDETQEAVRQMAELIAPLLPSEPSELPDANLIEAAKKVFGGETGLPDLASEDQDESAGGISPLELMLLQGRKTRDR